MADTSIVVRLVNETQQGFNQINRDLGNIKSGLASVATAFASAFTLGTVTKIANEVEQLNNKVKLVSNSSADFAKNYKTVYDIAQRTAAPLNELGDLYTKLSRSADVAGISTEQVGKVTETFANILKVSGTSAAGAGSAILQFSQAMQSGRLSGDEFRTILEQTPILLKLMADELGVTQGELREMAKEQRLSSEVVAKAMLLMQGRVEELAGKMNTTLSQAFIKVQNSLQDSVKDFLTSSGAVDVATKAMDYLAKNMDNILPILGLVGTALGAVAVVLAGPWIAGFTAAVAIGVAFADTFGPIAKTILGVLYDAFVAVISQIGGFAAALTELVKGNFGKVFESYEQGVTDVKNSLTPTTKATEDFTKASGDTSEQANKTKEQLDAQRAELRALVEQTKAGTSEYTKFIDKLKDQVGASKLDEEQKKIQQTVYQGLTAKAKDLKVSVGELSQEVRDQVETEVRASAEIIAANERTTKARQDAYKEAVDLLKKYADEARKDREEQLTATERYTEDRLAIEDAYNKALINGTNLTAEERKKIEQDYADAVRGIQTKAITDLAQKYKKYTEDSLTEAEKFAKDREEIEEAYRISGQAGEEAYLKALEGLRAKYGEKYRKMAEDQRKTEMSATEIFNDELQKLEQAKNDGLIKSQEDYDAIRRKIEGDYREATVKEYSNLYGLLTEKIQEFTGMNQKEFGILKDTVKLIFGVDLDTIIKTAFAEFIKYVIGFRTASETQMGFFPSLFSKIFGKGSTGEKEVQYFADTGVSILDGMQNPISGIFSSIMGFIKSAFSGGLSFIVDFVKGGLDLLGGFGKSAGSLIGDIFDGIGSIFGGGGGGGFDIFGTIGDIFGGGGDILGGIGDIFGGGGDILGGIGDIFSGGFDLSGALGSVAGMAGVFGILDLLGTFDDEPAFTVAGTGATGLAKFNFTDLGFFAAGQAQSEEFKSMLATQQRAMDAMKSPQNIASQNYATAQKRVDGGMGFPLDYAILGKPYPKRISDQYAYRVTRGESPLPIPTKMDLMRGWDVYQKAGATFPDQAWKGVYYYALGGVIDRPTMFGMGGGNIGVAGEAGSEAILPLERGDDGVLGVRMTGGGGNITFNINAIDAQGVEELLINKRQFITNMIRGAMQEKGRSFVR